MALNYPLIPSPEHYLAIIEEWFLQQCRIYIQKFDQVPDISCKMFCKILRLLVKLLTGFEDVKRRERTWHRFNLGDAGLSWDFNLTPDPKQMHGFKEHEEC